MGKTLVDKVWNSHVVRGEPGRDLLYIDLHLLHEVNTPVAFDGLRTAGRAVRRPDLTLGTEDHLVPTRNMLCVAILRTSAGRDPHDKGLHDLVGELSTRSEGFRRRWSSHNVRVHGTGTKRFHHHIVGDLTLAYESLEMVAEPGLTMTRLCRRAGLHHRTRLGSPRILGG
jgi:homoaconitase/3-isopropylmalate dehydratase large subunit